MLWKASDLRRFSLRATDGVIGDVVDLYFSDDSWTIRYLVAATGEWLGRREVLVSPLAIEIPLNAPAKVMPVNVTRREIRHAPPVDTHKPVSRHYEACYHDHFGWPYYWVGGDGWGGFMTPGELARIGTDAVEDLIDAPDNPHLRSTSEVEGYGFEGRDGKLGHVEDFIVNDESWSIRYLEIDTRNWWPGGKKVLLPTHWTSDVSWKNRKLRADVRRETVKRAPDYDESAPIGETFEKALANHYGLSRAVGAFR